MAKETNKKVQTNDKKMAKLIFFKKTSKGSVYSFSEKLMSYEEAVEKAKEITK